MLFYLARPIYGGWVSFTAHLALKHNLPVFKLAARTEKRQRPFGYGVFYRNTKDIPENPVITAIGPTHYHHLPSFPDKTWIVIHDPTELKESLLRHLHRFRIITIRASVQQFLKDTHGLDSLFLLHPFFPYPVPPGEKHTSVSVTRIDYDKNIDIILTANQQLPSENRVSLYGHANNRYVYHKLDTTAFRNVYRRVFPKTFSALNDILKNAKFCIDLSVIRNDGGGSQYTFLEAIHCGATLILHKRWLLETTLFRPGYNCYAIETPEELAKILHTATSLSAKELLEPHINVDWISHLTKTRS